jgi:pimeloyl-ACP methyl ester carboxylesterase
MFKSKVSYKSGFFLIPVILLLGYFGWSKWLLTVPKPLPTIAVKNSLNPGTYYEVSIPPTKTDKYSSANYRLWIPNEVPTIRGLIVKQHGCGDEAAATGLEHANDLQWQALALKHQFALIGAKYSTVNQVCEDWALLNSGSDNAFFKAVGVFAQNSHHPELNKVHWVLWGHSGGADWAAQMLQKHPDRTIAVVATRCGGATFPNKIDSKLFGVPILFAVAEKENTLVDECRDLPRRIFSRYRKENALWAIAVEANTTHETADTRLLAIPYFDALITARLTKDSNKLLAINYTQSWLGNAVTHEVASINQYKENPLEAAWLPNEETARKWQEYVTTGKISPTRPPKAPTNVHATEISSTEALITWKFAPDLENGLPLFRIYRNNSLIQTLQGQEHNFGDAPEPANIKLEFKDAKAKANSIYSVSAFNELGESNSRPKQLHENL